MRSRHKITQELHSSSGVCFQKTQLVQDRGTHCRKAFNNGQLGDTVVRFEDDLLTVEVVINE